MIEQSNYVPRQMNGPVINAFFEALEQELSNAGSVISYLKNLSISTAQETELESIGCIIGYPRPLVPEGFNAENVMLLGTLPLTTDELLGLSKVGSEVGGQLSSVDTSEGQFMSLGDYAKILTKMAEIKRNGITLKSVDDIVSAISQDYTISWDESGDISVTFNSSIGYKNVWLLTQLFYRVCTEPQVLIETGDE